MNAQLTLPVSQVDGACFENFYAPGDEKSVSAIRKVATATPANGAVFLSGASGTGKTHLCWSACRSANDAGLSAMYVPLRRADIARSMLDNLSSTRLLCLDDIDCVAGDGDWNRLLFSVWERHYLGGNLRLIATADRPATELNTPLKDLGSRLVSLLAVSVRMLSDAEKAEALKQRARRRGMEVEDEVVEYIMRRLSRSTHALFRFLDRLDGDSLRHHRKITVPFARSLLEQEL